MNKLKNILKYNLVIFAILLVQIIDYAYFEYLHKGLKYPDYFPIMFLSIFIAWKFIIKKSFQELFGVKINNRKEIKKQFFEGVKYGSVVVLLALIAGLLTFQIKYSLNTEYLKLMSYSIFGYLIFIPISSLYEELHYRGLYLVPFQEKYFKYFIIIISSIIFSYVHLPLLDEYSPYYPINLFLIGMILSFLRMRKNNVIICTGFHAAWNFLLIALSPLFNQQSERYVEFAVVTTIILVLFLGYEIYKAGEKV